jgi:hypothetical protein
MRTNAALAAVLICLAAPAAAKDCYNQHYDIQRLVNRDESLWVDIRRGPVEKIHVQWHDNVGLNHKAEGEVYLDGALVGRDDIKADGNQSDFLVRRFSDAGEVRVRIVRDNAFVEWVNVKYCDDDAGRGGAVDRLSRNMAVETDGLYRAAGREARTGAQFRALHDLDELRRSAHEFYAGVAGTGGKNRARSDFRRLEHDFEKARQSMRIANFSFGVDRQWDAIRGIFRDIEDRYGY